MKNKLKLPNGLIVIIVIIGILVIIYGSLGMVYFNKHSKSQNLSSQITQKQTILQIRQPDIKELNAQLEKAEAELESIKTSLPNTEQGIDIYGVLVDLGKKCNIQILKMEAATPISPKEGETSSIMPYTLTVEGSYDNALLFISNLIQGKELLQGLELRNIDLQNGDSPNKPTTVLLELYIHSWPDLTAYEQDAVQTDGSKK